MSATGAATAGEAFDVFLAGLLFCDTAFTGLDAAPKPGAEVWTEQVTTSPGGIANFAVALGRLGLRVALAAAFGDDLPGEWCWQALSAGEGVDLSRSRRFAGWPTPVTVSLAYGGDRALVTHAQPAPLAAGELVGTPPACRAAIVHIGPESLSWVDAAHAAGTLVFADVGWDPTGRWDTAVLDRLASCHAFLPNAAEAMAYTRTTSPPDALARLADLVPLAVVTCGADGALAVDGSTGETAAVPALSVAAVDTTGAGDVFGAALVAGTLAGLPLGDRLRFAGLAAALSVQRPGGASSAPGLADLARWWHAVRTSPDPQLRRDHAFLDRILPTDPADPADPARTADP